MTTAVPRPDQSGPSQPLRVALLGGGTVGGSVARMLLEQADDLEQRIGRRLEIVGIAVRRAGRDRSDLGVDASLFTTDAAELVTRADIVVELIGGIEPARGLILSAMEHGASVVTANKALLAKDGASLHTAASEHGVDLYYEASVAGAIPILRPIRDSLAGDSINRIIGIVNGTTNFVLDAMDTTGAGLFETVERAQALGYAEADPTADVEGFDAAAKAAILSSLAFHSRVSTEDVHREGITGVGARDIQAAQDMGCTVKLLAICEKVETPHGTGISARVHPAMIPLTHPLASVREAYNAVFVEAEAAGDLMFYGQGAGGDPTASAVLGDIVAVARTRVTGGRGPGASSYANLPVLSMGEAITRYHVSLDVEDRSGVLAAVATKFAEHDVSIETVRQQVVTDEEGAPRAMLIIVTHAATDAALSATVDGLAQLDAVNEVTSVMRVEGN
ncbi:homoserine dehydrogenase [Janibacter cremeus]|uniref:homoserine dehydrogenase n=1 Tax=Janibacter cremeus TaxID=1285192 RepID=UPI0023F8522A|nr:homoserine dehydrogenase [Janibacter cremeus]WEV78329.1 homoserine dehydrogenase [Janibacter cremeus]